MPRRLSFFLFFVFFVGTVVSGGHVIAQPATPGGDAAEQNPPPAAAAGADRFRHRYTAAEIGGRAPVRAVVIARDGTTWVASGRGLHVFDGEIWRTVGGMEEVAVQTLAVDPAGRVWYAGVAYFGWVEKSPAGVWTSHPLNCPELTRAAEALGSAFFRRIAFHAGQTYVMFGSRSLLVRVDAEGATHAIPLADEGRSMHVWEGAIRLQTLQKAWRIEGDTAVALPATTPFWRNYNIRPIVAFWPREAGDFWVLGNKALRRWNRADDMIYSTAEIARAVGTDLIYEGCPLGRDRAALATHTLGVLITEPSTGKILERINEAAGLGMGGDFVNGLAVAEDGALWIAHSGGLACVPPERLAPPSAAAAAVRPVPPRYSGLPLTRIFTENETGIGSLFWDVLQHTNGLIYAAGGDGIVEFDGVTWRTLSTRGSYRLASDRRGRLFYGAVGEFGEFVPDAEGRLRREPLSQKLPGDQGVGQWRALLVSGNEVYFFAQDRGLLVRLDEQDALQVIPVPKSSLGMIEWESKIYLVGGRTIYRVIGERTEGLTEPPAVFQSGAARGGVRSIWPAEDGASWVFTASGGPWRVTRDGKWSGSGEVARLLGSDTVSNAIPLADGTFALATRSHGLLLVDREQRVLARYDEDRGLGQASGTVNRVTTDGEGGLWAAHSGGLTRLQVDGPGALHGLAMGLRGPVRSLALHRGRLYAGTRQGLFQRNPLTGVFSAVPRISGEVSALHSLKEGLMIAGARLVLRDDRDLNEDLHPGSLAYGSIMVLPRDPDRLAVTTSMGLAVLRRTAGRWAMEGFVENAKERYSADTADAAGFVWLQRSSGQLTRLDWRQGVRLDAPIEELGPAHGVPSVAGWKRQFLHDGSVMLVHGGKLLRHDSATDRFVPETRIVGLENESVPRMTFSLGDGSLWTTHLDGARGSGFARPTGPGAWKFAWDAYSGFESITASATLLDSANRTLWVGSSQAATQLASFDLARARPQAPPPAARVRRVEADRRTLWGGAGAIPSVPLQPEQKNLKFSFAAPIYRADTLGQVELGYRTQLVGFDREWSAWSEDTTRTYTNLPPGNFTFRVQARGDDYREGPESTYAFRLLPPWWRTWWFIGLLSVTGVGSVAGVTRWLANRALRRQLERVEAQSAVERERLRLARDLHDEIGSGLGRVVLFTGEAWRGRTDPAKLDAALDRVRDSAQELMQHAREIVWAVSPQHDTLASVIERVGDYVEEILRAAGIACRLEMPTEVPAAAPLGSEVRHSLFLAVKEAVHNCVKYSGATTAECRIEINEGHLVIVLRDHGQGFAAGEIRGTGHGLPNIAARLDALGGSGIVTSEPGQGTTVTLRVPLGKLPAA